MKKLLEMTTAEKCVTVQKLCSSKLKPRFLKLEPQNVEKVVNSIK